MAQLDTAQDYTGAPEFEAPTLPRIDGKRWRASRRHSFIVKVLRIVLPVIALAIVAAMFISTRSLPTGVGDLSIEEIGLDGTTLTMKNPRLTGFTKNSAAYEVVADKALQDLTNPKVVTLQGIDGTITEQDGRQINIKAREGVFDSDREFLTLDKQIVVRSNEGHTAYLRAAEVDMKAGTVISNDPIRIEVLEGWVRARRMVISERGENFKFTGRVRMTIRLDGKQTEDTEEEAANDQN